MLLHDLSKKHHITTYHVRFGCKVVFIPCGCSYRFVSYLSPIEKHRLK
nr:MAG TPA: hypothetical protein [Caudoviricetes sp.]